MKTIEIDDHLANRIEGLRYSGKTTNDVICTLLYHYLKYGSYCNANQIFDVNLASRFYNVKPQHTSADKFLHGLLDYYISRGKIPIIKSGSPWSLQYISNYLKNHLDKEYPHSQYNFEKLLWFLIEVERNCECHARAIWKNGSPVWQLPAYMTRQQRARLEELSRDLRLKNVEPTHLLFSPYYEPEEKQTIIDRYINAPIKLAITRPRTWRHYLVFIFHLPTWQKILGETIPTFDVLHDGEKLSIEAKLRMKKW